MPIVQIIPNVRIGQDNLIFQDPHIITLTGDKYLWQFCKMLKGSKRNLRKKLRRGEIQWNDCAMAKNNVDNK